MQGDIASALDIVSLVLASLEPTRLENNRPTTVKMRTFARDRQIARADFESREEVKKEAIEKLLSGLSSISKDISAIVIEDYNKGLLTASFIKEILKIAKKFDLKVISSSRIFRIFLLFNFLIFENCKFNLKAQKN